MKNTIVTFNHHNRNIAVFWLQCTAIGGTTPTANQVFMIVIISIIISHDYKQHCYPPINVFAQWQAGTSWGESSKPDLFLNFIHKVRMLRFLRHSWLKCRKSSFWEQNIVFVAFLRTEDWGLRIEVWRLRIEDWGHLLLLASFSAFETTKILKNPHRLEKIPKARLEGLNNLCHPELGTTGGKLVDQYCVPLDNTL